MLQRLTSLRLHPVQLGWFAALFFATLGNAVLWRTLWSTVEVDSLRSLWFFISLPVFLFCLLNLLLTAVLAVPYVRKPLLALLVVVSAVCSYFMLHYNVLIDRGMVQNAFETNRAELTSYISAPLVLTILVLGVLPAAAMVLLPTGSSGRPLHGALWWLGNVLATLAVLAAVTMAFYKDYASLLRNHRQIRDQVLPFNFVRNANGYLKRRFIAKRQVLRSVGEDAVRPAAAAGGRPAPVDRGGRNRAGTELPAQRLSACDQSVAVAARRHHQLQACGVLRHRHRHFPALHVLPHGTGPIRWRACGDRGKPARHPAPHRHAHPLAQQQQWRLQRGVRARGHRRHARPEALRTLHQPGRHLP